MRNIVVLAIMLLGLVSCNEESVKITGEIKGFEGTEMSLYLKSKAGAKEMVLENVEVDKGEFKIAFDGMKPPLKLTLDMGNDKTVDFWVFKYGKMSVEFDASDLSDLTIKNSFENDELKRINDTYDKMYLTPLKEDIKWIKENQLLDLKEADQEKLAIKEAKVEKAKQLRRKAILSTVRKSPKNPIAMALFFDEFETLTSWQKEECNKTSQKYYSDTKMNWQLKN